ncbi:hypothetical protein Tco_0823654 [Tanacetum coccineum]|uniref:PB1-like domain-containing protein n=1 Tax=Tanacetum coccineum TaxID=301880 RepID=A0ABQ5AII7_9ASTR
MEECHKMLTAQVDWTNPEGDHFRIDVNRPLPLGGPPGHVTIQPQFFFNKDLEYLRYGSKGSNPALSISKMKAASYLDFGLELLVPEQMWIDDVCTYDISAKYGISHWWFNRQKFYIDRHDSPSRRKDVRTHMRILSVVRIKAYSRYGYDYLSEIVLRRADFQEHTIAEKDFKNLYPSDFEDLNLLLLQGHLDHLPGSDKRMLSTAVKLWTRNLVIRQRVKDFQLGIESYQTQLNLTKPGWDATGYEFKHDYTIIESPRAVVFPVNNNERKIMRFNEIYKFSDGTLTRILEALDYRVKEFKVKRLNPAGKNNLFSVKLHHGGKFTPSPKRMYVRGKVNYVDKIDVDIFNVDELHLFVQDLGYDPEQLMFYHYKLPSKGLDYGLKPISCDADVISLIKLVANCKVVEVFVEYWLTSVDHHYLSLFKSIVELEELDDDVLNAPLVGNNKMLALCWINEADVAETSVEKNANVNVVGESSVNVVGESSVNVVGESSVGKNDNVSADLNVNDYTIDDRFAFDIDENLNLEDYTVYVDQDKNENVNVVENVDENMNENVNADDEYDSITTKNFHQMQNLFYYYHNCTGKFFALLHYLHCQYLSMSCNLHN